MVARIMQIKATLVLSDVFDVHFDITLDLSRSKQK